ncbi:MAG: nucleotidyltransferase domain-containing protein [Candidatus Atribacteria bacterium]
MDLFRITKSRLREGLLALYFTNPNKKYYLRELERILNFSVGNIRRELIKLRSTGLFLSENKGNLVYYYLNQSYPLFKELKSIILKTSGAPKMLQKILEKFDGISQAFIYGSFAKGEKREDSDIDLLIIGKVNEDKLVEVISKLEKKLQREINYTIYEKEDFKKKKEEGNPFILEILKEKKIFLI